MAFTQIEAAGITSTGAVVLENATVTGVLTATSFSGSGASLITLNASNISSGTLPDARFPATLPAVSGANLTGISGIPSGTVITIAASTAPTGYLNANGASLNTTTYASLFSTIGYTFGGSGASFTLPDLRGEFIRGWADDRAVDTARAFGSSQSQSYESHNHAITDPGHFHTSISSDGQLSPASNDYSPGEFGAKNIYENTTSKATGITINNNGSTETRPRNIALLYCIKF